MSAKAMIWLGALGLDLVRGEPPASRHPVVLLGRAIEELERRAPSAPRAQLAYGALLVAIPVGVAAATGLLAARLRPAALRLLACAWLLKTTFALRELVGAAGRVRRALARGDHEGARAGLRALVSRDVHELDDAHLASAAVESLAENLSDSFVAPLWAYAVAGVPGALAYRAVNTADAMVGYHGRYEHLGKIAARLDDALNLVPARLTALALVVAAPLVGLDGARALRVALRDHARTESPNAGWPMAATAGATGVWLEKPDHYRLGDGRAPSGQDIEVVERLVLAAAFVATLGALLVWRGRDG